MTEMKLEIYVDPLLLNPVKNVGNLTLGRKVAGKVNVIFQSKIKNQITAGNRFQWTQSYAIAATTDAFADGALVGNDTTQQPIRPGLACIWKPGNGDMPPASQAPASFPAGSFGTVNLPDPFSNTIWCQTGTDTSGNPIFSAIYADENPVAGLVNRSYIVSNDYQVSWESTAGGAGVFMDSFSDPQPFSYTPTETERYISWGYPAGTTPGNQDQFTPSWWDYGTTDPSKHDPANGTPFAPALDNPGTGDDAPQELSFHCGWDSDKNLSDEGRRHKAAAVSKYLISSGGGLIDFQFDRVDTAVNAVANLRTSSPAISDMISGSNSIAKTRALLWNMVSQLDLEWRPSEFDFDLVSSGDDSGLSNGVDPPTNTAILLGLLFTIGTAIGPTVVDLIATYIKTSLEQKADVTKVNIKKESTAPNVSVSYTITVECPTAKLTNVLKQVGDFMLAEQTRTVAPPVSPPIPATDPVSIVSVATQLENSTTVLGLVKGTAAHRAFYRSGIKIAGY